MVWSNFVLVNNYQMDTILYVRQTHHFTIIMRHFVLECRHGAGKVGEQLPKPEHLGPGKMVDNVQCCYPARERLVAINGGKVWAMHQAVESFTDQLFVCVCWFMYEWRVVINLRSKKLFLTF